jgi:hypothetical protein
VLWHENLLQPKQASGTAMSTTALESHGEGALQFHLQQLNKNTNKSNEFITFQNRKNRSKTANKKSTLAAL